MTVYSVQCTVYSVQCTVYLLFLSFRKKYTVVVGEYKTRKNTFEKKEVRISYGYNKMPIIVFVPI